MPLMSLEKNYMNSELTIHGARQVSLNHLEAVEFLEEAMTAMMMKVRMCEFYTGIYEGATKSEALGGTLFSALSEFHACVIVLSIKTRGYFHAKCKIIILITISLQNAIHETLLITTTPHTRDYQNSKHAQTV